MPNVGAGLNGGQPADRDGQGLTAGTGGRGGESHELLQLSCQLLDRLLQIEAGLDSGQPCW